MKIRRLDINRDWTFGNGVANYAIENEAILQNVETRLKSFKNDWFLDFNAGIDWFNILGSKQNKQTIKNEIKRICLQSDGVIKVNSVDIEAQEERNASVSINLDTIYSINEVLGVEI